jgi:hypothetical protein
MYSLVVNIKEIRRIDTDSGVALLESVISLPNALYPSTMKVSCMTKPNK